MKFGECLELSLPVVLSPGLIFVLYMCKAPIYFCYLNNKSRLAQPVGLMMLYILTVSSIEYDMFSHFFHLPQVRSRFALVSRVRRSFYFCTHSPKFPNGSENETVMLGTAFYTHFAD